MTIYATIYPLPRPFFLFLSSPPLLSLSLYLSYRSVKCDQDAFDLLYESYLDRFNAGDYSVGNIRDKVVILERDALNSGQGGECVC
jgi:hypothetical protein